MDYKNINDYEILYMINENNDDATNFMVQKYYPIVKNIASKYYQKVMNKGVEFQDLIQEGNIGLFNAINGYNAKFNTLFYSYACLCIERRLTVFCRGLCSKKSEILNNCYYSDDLFANYISNGISDQDKYIDERFRQEEFIRYKNYFNILDSSIFQLRYNGFTYKEISELLDISISTVDGRLSKIRRVLHKHGKNFV